MTLWLGISPMCVDQVKNRYHCSKVALENTVKNMHSLMVSPFVRWILITEIFSSAILCFYNYFHIANCNGRFTWDAMFLVHLIVTADTWCCLQCYPVCLVFILHAYFLRVPYVCACNGARPLWHALRPFENHESLNYSFPRLFIWYARVEPNTWKSSYLE